MYRWLLMAVFMFGASTGFARDATMAYLNWNADTYSTGLSAGSVTAGRTVSSLEANPALISDWKEWQVGGTFSQPIPLFSNIAHTFGGLAFPFSEKITVALSGHQYWLGRQGRTPEGSSKVTNGYDTKTTMGRVSAGFALRPGIDIGVSLVGLWTNIDGDFAYEIDGEDKSHTAFYADIGAVWKGNMIAAHHSTGIQIIDDWAPQVARHRWKMGIAFQNFFGQQMSFIDADQADPLPRNIRIGGQLLLYQNSFAGGMIAVDAENQITSRYGIDRIGAGMELRILQIGVLTAGYTWRTGKFTANYSSTGIGVETRIGSVYFAQKTTMFTPVYAWEGGVRWTW